MITDNCVLVNGTLQQEVSCLLLFTLFLSVLTKTFSHFTQGLGERIWHNAIWYSDPTSL